MVVVYIGHMFFFVVCRSSNFSLVAVDIFRQSANTHFSGAEKVSFVFFQSHIDSHHLLSKVSKVSKMI